MTPAPVSSDLSRLVHREVVLLVLLTLAAAGLFVATRMAAGATRAREAADAATWLRRGEAAMARRDYAEAAEALRRSAALRPDEWVPARALADALSVGGRGEAARLVLERWRTRDPQNPEVALRLARIEDAAGNLDRAVDDYEAALHGRWTSEASRGRLEIRRELVERLLAAGRMSAALAHVLSLAANVDETPEAQVDVGRLFVRAGDLTHALEHFRRALRRAPVDLAARAGAADAAFRLGNDADARAFARGLTDARSRHIAAVTAAVAALDPLAARISAAERNRRLAAVVAVASEAFEQCLARAPTPTPLQARSDAALRRALQEQGSVRGAPPIDETSGAALGLVARALAVAVERCSPLDARAEGVWRITRRHGAGA